MTDSATVRTTLSSPATRAGDDLRAYARALCREHTPRLLVMASLLLQDAGTADDIVAATIAAAAHDGVEPTGPDLARSVYHRCIGHLAVPERFPGLARPAGLRPAPFDHLTQDERVVLALVLFGGLDVAQTASTLRREVPIVAAQIARALSLAWCPVTGG